MRTFYLNSFIESAKSVLNMVCSIDVKSNNSYLRSPPILVNQVIIIVGIIGKIKGQVFFEISLDTSKKIVSAMMGGIPVIELDEIGKSAISEMANMIMGNTSIILSGKNINIDITPPTVLIGEHIEISNKFSTIEVPFDLEGMGALKVYVSAEELI